MKDAPASLTFEDKRNVNVNKNEMNLVKDEEYMKRYRAYWNPIMQEHQKKADEM